jgi:hypothetical protein
MELTIIGVYDDLTHARSAKNDLLTAGFPRSHVQLNPDHDLPATRGPSVQKDKNATISASVGNFFRSLFSMDDKSTYSHVYAEAVRRGSYVLTVDVDSDGLRARAEGIMGRYGPVDIDERSEDWIRHGWLGHDPQAAGHAAEKAGNPPNAGTVRAFPRRKKNGGPD